MPTPVLWLRGDSITVADGEKVPVWPDISGNHLDATSISEEVQPTYKESIVNGKSVVRFDTETTTTECPESALLDCSEATLFCVTYSVPGSGSQRSIVSKGVKGPDLGAAYGLAFADFDSEQNVAALCRNTLDTETTYRVPTTDVDDWNVWVISYTGGGPTTVVIRQCGFPLGTQIVSTGGLETDGSPLRIGQDGFLTGCLGDIAEIRVYSGNLDWRSVNKIEVELGKYYDIPVYRGLYPMTLAEIRQLAMDRVDEQTNPTTGRFSTAWWDRQINYVWKFLAQHTGFYIKRTELSPVSNSWIIPAPDDLAWGIMRATYDGTLLEANDIFEVDEDAPSWESSTPGTPTTYMVNWPNIELYPLPNRWVQGQRSAVAPAAGGTVGRNFYAAYQPLGAGVFTQSTSTADTQTMTIYGVRTGALTTVVKEVITMAGTSQKASIYTDWQYILGGEVASVPTGKVVLYVASTNTPIITLDHASGVTTAGIADLSWSGDAAYPTVYSSSTSTDRVGLIGTDEYGTDSVTNLLYDNCVALSGTANAAGVATFPTKMTTTTRVLCGCVPATEYIRINTLGALEVMHGAVPTDLTADIDPDYLPAGFHYLLADGAAVLALTGDLRYNESVNSQTSPLMQQFWQGVGQLEAFLDTMQRDRVSVMKVVSPHSPYA